MLAFRLRPCYVSDMVVLKYRGRVVTGADGKAVVEDLKLSGGEYSIRLDGVANFVVRRNLLELSRKSREK